MYETFVFSGFGGQGVMFVGQLLAYAAMDVGLQVTWIPSYGPEMRGGTAHCFVTISDKVIGSPIIKHPKVAVVFNNPSFDKYEPFVAPDGVLVVNSSLVTRQSTRTDMDTLYVPATRIAEEIGSPRVANLVLPISAVEKALAAHIAPHRRDLLELNYQALHQDIDFALPILKHNGSPDSASYN